MRVYNFSAGPAMLPKAILKEASKEMLNFQNTGQSVMEMSHRSKEFLKILEETKQLLAEIMKIPKNYEILFLQGGASLQFSMVPLNLMLENKSAGYILTGNWAKKAYIEAQKFGKAKVIASSEDKDFCYIPNVKKEDIDKNLDYVHICLNNTIYGTKYSKLPDLNKEIPLIADVSSCILSEPIDVSKFGLIYASAQKNMACAGLTVVIIRKDLINNAQENTPTMLSYKTHADKNSLYNTPPSYCIYMCKLMLEWIKNHAGSLDELKKINTKKAQIIYDYLDNSKLFKTQVYKKFRSITNIPFFIDKNILDEKFIAQAKENNIINIKGHRLVGGMRASLYNGMPISGAYALVEFMEKFEKENS